jgi:hypothetical protein
MMHDSSGNTCPAGGYIMQASSDYDSKNAITAFSSCSASYLNSAVKYRSESLNCLENVPQIRWNPSSSTCGNGIVDRGNSEECDCGDIDCSAIDPCCDGKTCKLYSYAECSSLDLCCSSKCTIIASSENKICRFAKHDSCDIPEYCNGHSSFCPIDSYYNPGKNCIDSFSKNGVCSSGNCISPESQCLGLPINYAGACQAPLNPCGEMLRCKADAASTTCSRTQAIYYSDGTQCSSGAVPEGLCFQNVCTESSKLNYKWDTFCDWNCGDSNTIRTSKCRRFDGVWVEDSLCKREIAGEKPEITESCGEFSFKICSLDSSAPVN